MLAVAISVGLAASGAGYLLLGSKYASWDVQWEPMLYGARLSWKQALAIVAFAIALLAISLWICFSFLIANTSWLIWQCLW